MFVEISDHWHELISVQGKNMHKLINDLWKSETPFNRCHLPGREEEHKHHHHCWKLKLLAGFAKTM
jgi:hypothetical protein